MSPDKAGQKVLLVHCLNAVYGTMVAALLYYKMFVKSLTKQGYKINLYNGCMVNKVVKGKQVTICFHIDDCKISHKSSAVIDNTIAWLRTKYESIFEDGLGQMKVNRGLHTSIWVCHWISPTRDNAKSPCIIILMEYCRLTT